MQKNKKITKLACYVVCIIVLGVVSKFMNFTDSFWGFFSSIHVSLAVILRLIGMVLLVLVIEGVVKLVLESLKIENKHRAKTVVTVLNSSIRYLAAIVIICWGLSIIGVDVATIAASVGIVALIIGFGAESLIEDAITGIFMLFENQYNVGDIIEVNGFRGEVSEIGIRTTSVKDGSNNVKIINNAQMKNVLNRSDNYSSAVCDIGIPYETDLEAFESKVIPGVLKNIYEANSEVITAEPKYLGVQELGESAVILRFSCQCVEKDIYNAARILNHDLLIQFGKNGVHCPYQKLDVHNI